MSHLGHAAPMSAVTTWPLSLSDGQMLRLLGKSPGEMGGRHGSCGTPAGVQVQASLEICLSLTLPLHRGGSEPLGIAEEGG